MVAIKLVRPRELEELKLHWQRILAEANRRAPAFGYLDTPRAVPLNLSGTQLTVGVAMSYPGAAEGAEWIAVLESAMASLFGYSWILTVARHDGEAGR